MTAPADTAPADTTAGRTRGRPREFAEDEVLDRLLRLFWEQGFESASLQEIVEASGLNKSSLYNAFGSKDELFFRVLDRYVEIRRLTLTDALAEGGLDRVLDFIEMIRGEATNETGLRGCLAVNASTELGLRSDRVAALAHRFRSALREALRQPLERAAALGEIDPRLVDSYVETLLSFAVSVAVAARGGAARAELDTTIDAMRGLVVSWRRAEVGHASSSRL